MQIPQKQNHHLSCYNPAHTHSPGVEPELTFYKRIRLKWRHDECRISSWGQNNHQTAPDY
jgi:hypothetical protein